MKAVLFVLLCGFVFSFSSQTEGQEVFAAGDTRNARPLFHEATNQFGSMKSTWYQYRTEVNRDAGSYRYDCVGFVSYALKTAAPQAWSSVTNITGIKRGRIPGPTRYRESFASLVEKPQPGWKAVTKASDLRPGDVVAWEHKTASAVGHVVVIGDIPIEGALGSWSVKVYDSTSSPHSDDSRPGDPRATVLESNGRRSGLGHGVMIFMADPDSGALTGLRWSAKAKVVAVPIAAARPLF